jgi:chromosome segregation ATPase
VKIKDYVSDNPRQKAVTKPKQTLFDAYNEERIQREIVEQLNENVRGKRQIIEKLEQTIDTKEQDLRSVEGQIDLSHDQLEIILQDVVGYQQELRQAIKEAGAYNLTIVDLEEAIRIKRKQLEPIEGVLYEISIKKQELHQTELDINEKRRAIEKLGGDMILRQMELEDFSKSYRNKGNILDAIDIEIQNKQAELDMLQIQVAERKTEKATNGKYK